MIGLLRASGGAGALSAGRVRLLLAGLLLGVGLAVRLLNAHEPPLDFHATRQYRSLLIARAYFLDSAPAEPAWRREVADVNRERQGVLEPPVMELLVAGLYRALGGEQLWAPRLIASLFWLGGAIFLYRIGLRVGQWGAAALATMFYLFLPFAVVASRSFQPDPLMVMLLLASALLALRYHKRPSWGALLGAASVAAGAIFVKPVSLFVAVGAFLALSVGRLGWRSLLSKETALFLGLSALPSVAFYAYGVWAAGTLRSQAEASFVPQMLASGFFWKGWLKNIDAVVGLPAFVAALLGLALAPRGDARSLLLGMWAGYGLFCLVFSYHIASHDYYHLQLVPIVALSLIPLAELVIARLAREQRSVASRLAPLALLLFALLLALGLTLSRQAVPGARQRVLAAAEIGRLVNHSTATAVLSPDYGLPLEYHGELSATPWPISSDLEWERLAGVPAPSADERFDALMEQAPPDYFVVLDYAEYEAQGALKALLSGRFPVLAHSDAYLIFDLRRPARP